jgi:hypothetical protein
MGRYQRKFNRFLNIDNNRAVERGVERGVEAVIFFPESRAQKRARHSKIYVN